MLKQFDLQVPDQHWSFILGMGNFFVSSVCHAHRRSEAVYAIVKAQIKELRGHQRRGSPLQQQCAKQQAAFLHAISSKMALTAAVMKCWMMAATARARVALITSLVFIAKKFVAGASPQMTLLPQDYDDIFDEFNAVFETTPRPSKTLRELQHSAKVESETFEPNVEVPIDAEIRGTPEDGESCTVEETEDLEQLSDLESEYELLPNLDDDQDFYVDDNQVTSESAHLLQLASSISDTSMHVEDFISEGKHDNFENIIKDVDTYATEASDSKKRSIVRILLAYCTYSEDSNYSSDMVVTAEECLEVWQGDEDRAFKSLAVLCNDVPRLCAALE
ncbi:hypothetical protein F443_16244 [Plasmopara halstedii]|uniref:Uncharacterized protein n=1 Tax=Plasmopara halstedii TaxID=4781 RepID=A0A0N7L6Y5_PLAHL|nr:hypothetical protein F443_16244 [Plasmopara halstedii]CEG45571.1 hypothetical protein F443_16244 [Plasmopara halstedii]|eukprot:XP_024581940.1 hypothetical protein F443_16244 [Plasmopara halstedii]